MLIKSYRDGKIDEQDLEKLERDVIKARQEKVRVLITCDR